MREKGKFLKALQRNYDSVSSMAAADREEKPALRNNVGVVPSSQAFPDMLEWIFVDAGEWGDLQALIPKVVTDLTSARTEESQHFLTRAHRLWSRKAAQELVRFRQKYEELERDFIQLRSEHTKLQTLGRNLYGHGSKPIVPYLGGWTSIYHLFWCSPGVQGFDPLPDGLW